MKIIIVFILLVSTTFAHGIDRAKFLAAISMVESGGNPAKRGKAGERGMYQFTSIAWRQHTKQKFTRAHEKEFSTKIAELHFDWLAKNIEAKGSIANSFTIAVCWNAGLTRGMADPWESSIDYAQRVTNLYVDSTQPAQTPGR
jgi:hypothetical protein